MPGGGGGSKPPKPSKEERAAHAASAKLMGIQGELSREAWDTWKRFGIPQLESMSTELADMSDPHAEVAQAEGLAATDVGQSYDQAKQGLMNTLGRFGMRPGSGRFLSSLRSLALGRAADTAGAKTTARMGILDRFKARKDALRAGLAGMTMNQGQAGLRGVGAAGRGLGQLGSSMQSGRLQGWKMGQDAMWQGIGTMGQLALGAYALSDRRLKRDVKVIGELPGKLNLYEFAFIDEPDVRHTGCMADEVAAVWPERVRLFRGLLMVDYDGLMKDMCAWQG